MSVAVDTAEAILKADTVETDFQFQIFHYATKDTAIQINNCLIDYAGLDELWLCLKSIRLKQPGIATRVGTSTDQ